MNLNKIVMGPLKTMFVYETNRVGTINWVLRLLTTFMETYTNNKHVVHS